MIQGLYKVAFKGLGGFGSGVVLVNGGQFQGGDSCLYYYGTLVETNSSLTGQLNVRRHTEGRPSVFGVDNVSVPLTGSVTSSGFSLAAPGDFSVTGTPLQT